jgi:hypothetical protein
LNLNDFFLLARFGLGMHACLGGERTGSRLVGFPARPPGCVPGVEPGEDRPRPFHPQLADGAIGAAVDLLDEEGAHCNVAEIRIEFDCGFHFDISLLIEC